MEKPDVEALFTADVEELYAEIGRKVGGRAALPPTMQELVELGRAWLESRSDELAATICPSKRIKQLYQIADLSDRRAQLITAIADLISGLVVGVPPWTVSALLVRLGLESLCKDSW